jgi:hypothetical protein
MQRRAAAGRKSPIKNLHSVTSEFSRPWPSPAAKSRTPTLGADSTGTLRSSLPSMPQMPENHDDEKLGLAAEMLRAGRTVHLTLRGTSMLPSLWPGDLLTIESAASDEVVPGDIVLVMRDNRSFAHRLVERRVQHCPSLITKGDAVRSNDPPVARSEVLGRVACVRRSNRSFVPSRRVSPPRFALAWMFCRWDRFRNLALRIHAARLQASPTFGARSVRAVFSEARRISGISPSRSSQS